MYFCQSIKQIIECIRVFKYEQREFTFIAISQKVVF